MLQQLIKLFYYNKKKLIDLFLIILVNDYFQKKFIIILINKYIKHLYYLINGKDNCNTA